MKEHVCQIVSREDLVAYADGDLLPSEAERIAKHIATCPDCRTVAEALERSLQVAQTVWQTAQAQWPETHPFDRIRSHKWSFRKALAVAASVLLFTGAGTVWRLLSEPSERMDLTNEETKVAELRLKIADSGDAARLLAAAELLSRYPDAESSVEQRYRHIIETYPDTAAAAKAKRRMH